MLNHPYYEQSSEGADTRQPKPLSAYVPCALTPGVGRDESVHKCFPCVYIYR